MDWINPHIFGWFIVPIFMYLLLFASRDKFNILNMPLADFVALLVVADVALAVNFGEMAKLVTALKGMHIAVTPPTVKEHFWALAVLGVAVCIWLIFVVENKIFTTVIRHVSVGLVGGHRIVFAVAGGRHAALVHPRISLFEECPALDDLDVSFFAPSVCCYSRTTSSMPLDRSARVATSPQRTYRWAAPKLA